MLHARGRLSMRLVRSLLLVAAAFAGAACASATSALVREPFTEVAVASDRNGGGGAAPAAVVTGTSLDSETTRAIERRIGDLKARGGSCAAYGAVLETSYRGGQIIVRPYMWRVGSQLTSGEAKPNGEMILAREIDPLNVGVRTLDDFLWTMEHEAAHIAFKITNDLTEDRANEYVRACK